MSAYSLTIANFVQPATDGTVTVLTDATLDWMVAGAECYVRNGGYYLIFNIPSDQSVILKNRGYTGNAAAGAVIPTGSKIVPSGIAGADGANTETTQVYYTATDPRNVIVATRPAVCCGADGSLWIKTNSG